MFSRTKSVSSMLALRYLCATAYNNNVSWMVRICFIGIFIGSCSLALIHAIMHGYEQAIHKKMQGIHAQIIVHSYTDTLNIPAITQHIQTHIPEISALSPSMVQYALVGSEHTDALPTLVMLKGIDPLLEQRTSTLEQKIIIPRGASLDSCVHKTQILIGNGLAEQLHISVGDSIDILYAQDLLARGNKITMNTAPVTVGGIFKTGIDEFDTGVIYCSHELIHILFPDEGITHLNIALSPHASATDVIHKLHTQLHLHAYSWQELYPALVSALKLEKYAMFFILLLITLVASLNMISLLFMQITQKRADIAILYTLGASPKTVLHIFISMGMLIAAAACLLGIGCAWLICLLLTHYPFIELPDAYYVTHLPAIIDWPLVIIVFCAVMTISFLATWIIARRTRYINIADVLRFEG